MSLAQRFSSLSEEKKNLFILGAIALLGALVLVFSFFIDNPGLFYGWLLGSAIEILCYVTIFLGARFLLSGDGEATKGGLVGALFGTFRLLFYAGGLVLGGFATFVWGTPAHGYCNVFTVFAGYLPLLFVLLVTTYLSARKSKKGDTKPVEEEKKEGESENA